MSTDLVIGKAGYAHVHSHDFAQLIRGIMGKGKYRLVDRDNCNVVVTPGSVSIADGGIVWNGRYLRNWKDNPYTYASPASTQNVGVYLHYTKQQDTGIENCDFEVFVGSAAPTVTENFSDNTYDAYTLFYSFTHNANGTITNGTHALPLSKTTIDIEKLISDLTASAKLRVNERKLLASNIAAGSTVTLAEDINNFMYFEIVLEGSYATFPVADFDGVMRGSRTETRICIPSGASDSVGTVPYWGTRSLHIKLNGKSFKYARGITYILHKNGTFQTYESPTISRIYGVQRKW